MKMTKLETKCYNFVLQCYFGDMEDPIDAAIDRAYVDMASHTLRLTEEQSQKKWELRSNASTKIIEALNHLNSKRNYNDWHSKLCKELQKIYTEKKKKSLSYGQAQKWVNMTTKYLQVFAVIFKSMDNIEGLSKIPKFFWNPANIEKLHIPLDRYIMEEYQISDFGPWSKLDEEQYTECRKRIGDIKKTLEDELSDWGKIAKKHRVDDPKSYACFKKKKK